MCRNIIALFIGFLIIILLSLELFVGLIFIRTNSSDLYKAVLAENNIYGKLEEQFRDFFIQNITSQGFSLDEVGNIETDIRINSVYDDFYKTLGTESKNLFKDVINSEKIKVFIENNVDRIISFFNSNNNDLILFFPETELVNSIKNDITGLIQKGKDVFVKAKNCSASEEVKFYQDISSKKRTSLECLPTDLKIRAVSSLEKISSDFNKNFLSEKSEDNPLLDGDNEISYRELLTFNKANANEAMQNFKNVQQGFLFAKIALIANLVFIIILSIIFLVLFKANLFRKLGTYAIFIFIASFISIIANVVSGMLFISTIESNAKSYLGVTVVNEYSSVLVSLIRSLFDCGRNMSLILTVLAVVFIILFFVLDKITRRTRNKEEKVETVIDTK